MDSATRSAVVTAFILGVIAGGGCVWAVAVRYAKWRRATSDHRDAKKKVKGFRATRYSEMRAYVKGIGTLALVVAAFVAIAWMGAHR